MNKLKTITLSLVILFSSLLLDVSYAYVFNYRYTITINNTQNPNDLTDYQIRIVVDTTSLISNGYMRSDCGDIRFTDDPNAWNTLTTGFDYWIKPGTCNTYNTEIWVKVPEIPGNSTKEIYMYFGNSSASSLSNADKTFIFFDDFDGTSLNTSKWSVSETDPAGYYVSSGRLVMWNGAGGGIKISSKSSFSTANMLEFYAYASLSSYTLLYRGYYYRNVYVYSPSSMYLMCSSYKAISYDVSSAIWGLVTVGGQLRLYKNYELKNSLDGCTSATEKVTFRFDRWNSQAGTSYLYIYFVRVRKFTDPEPQIVLSAIECNPNYCYAACGASSACEGKENNKAYVCDNPDGCYNDKGDPIGYIPYKSTYYCGNCYAYDADSTEVPGTVCAVSVDWTECGGLGGPLCWSIGGSRCKSSGSQFDAYGCNEYCCGDDPNEYRINTSVVNATEFQNFTWSDATDMYGCCNSSSSCVYDDKCYFQGSANGMIGDAVCISNDTGSYWVHGDDNDTACYYTCSKRYNGEGWEGSFVSYCSSKTWAPGGEINEVPYGYGDRCCGDDNFNGIREVLTMSTVLNQSNFNSFNPSGDLIACCNLSSKCAYNDRCYENLTLVEDALCFNNFTYQDWSIVINATAGSGGSYWVNVDDYEWACSLANLEWISNSSRFESGNPYCCGDDLNEYYNYRNCEAGSSCTTDINDKACCDSTNDCVYNGVCYSSGSCYSIDGMKLYCLDGIWIDLDKNRSYCEACNYTWISNESIGLCCGDDLANDNFGIVNYSYCLYCKGGSSYSSDLLYYQGSLVGRCDYDSLMYNCSSGFYYNLSSYHCYYQVSCSSNGWEAIALDSFCPRNNSILYLDPTSGQSIWLYDGVSWYPSDLVLEGSRTSCYVSQAINGIDSCNATGCYFNEFLLSTTCESGNCRYVYNSSQRYLASCDRETKFCNHYVCSGGWSRIASLRIIGEPFECEVHCGMKYIVSELANESEFELFNGRPGVLYSCCWDSNYCAYMEECYQNTSEVDDAICIVNASGSYWHDIDDEKSFCLSKVDRNWSDFIGKVLEPSGKCCGDDHGLDTWENNESSASWCCCNGNVIVNATLNSVNQENSVCDFDGDGNYDVICINGLYKSCQRTTLNVSLPPAQENELIGMYFCNAYGAWEKARKEFNVSISTDKENYNIPDDTEIKINYSAFPTPFSTIKSGEQATLRIFLINDSMIKKIFERTDMIPFNGSFSYDIYWIRSEGDYEIRANLTYINEESEEVNATSSKIVHITPLRRINLTILSPSYNQSLTIYDDLIVKVNLNNTGVFDENVTLKIIIHDSAGDIINSTVLELKVGEDKNYTYVIPVATHLDEPPYDYNLHAFQHLIEISASYDTKQTFNSTLIYVEPYIDVNNTIAIVGKNYFNAGEDVSIASAVTSNSNFDIKFHFTYTIKREDGAVIEVIEGWNGLNPILVPQGDSSYDFSWNTDNYPYSPPRYYVEFKIRNTTLNIERTALSQKFDILRTRNVTMKLELDKNAYAVGSNLTVNVTLRNVGNTDVSGNLEITIVDENNRLIENATEYIGLSVLQQKSIVKKFYLDEDKYTTTRNRVVATYYYDSKIVNDSEEFTVGNVAVDIVAPEDKSSFFAYPEETIDFLVHVTTVNLTTGEVENLTGASASDFYIYDNYTNSYSLINFKDLGNGNYSFSIGIENKGSYRIYVRVRDPKSNVVGESYVDISIVVHKVTIRLVGLNGTNLYIPNKTTIDVAISPMTEDYLITKEELRDEDYYIFVYKPSFLLGLFFDPSYRGDLSYVRFDSPSTAGYNLSISSDYKGNSFLLVFTKGSKYLAISRYDLVKEDRFFSLVNPSFGFRIKDYVNVKLVYDLKEYNLNLTSEELKLPPGLYKFKIKNIGLVEGKVGIEVRRV